MAIELIALKKFKYGESRLVAGDKFKAKDKDVLLLCLSKLAAKDVPQTKAQTYETRHMEAAPVREAHPEVAIIEKSVSEMTRQEMLDAAGAKGVHLPSGYIPKRELIKIVEGA